VSAVSVSSALTRPSHGVVAALAYLAVAIAETSPLVLHLNDRVAHDPGDPLLVTYVLNWNARVLPLSEPWWHPPFFWPSPNAITLSDPYLGLAPAVWLLSAFGLNPVGVFNLLYIVAFWLTPLAAYFLTHWLTRDAAASLIAGLAFGYAPYRAAQLAHLQFLMVPALPLMFLALHRGVAHSGIRWAMFAAFLWLWQALTGLYFLLFVPLAVLPWLLWFAGPMSRLTAKTLVAFALAAAIAAPILLQYRRDLDAGAHARDFGEVISMSADVVDIAHSSPELAVPVITPWTAAPERYLFPGFTILALALVALSSVRFSSAGFRPVTIALLIVFALAAVISTTAIVFPFQRTLAGVNVSVTSPYKSLAVVWVAALGAMLSSRTVARACRDRSIALGYALIALALWILALGPEPAMAGSKIWYRGPYWLLYTQVPGFDGIRVPARLWTIVTLCLAVLAGIGAQRLLRGRSRSVGVAIIAAAILVEGSIALPVSDLPAPLVVPADADVVLELPAGDVLRDSAAMFRSLSHQRPVLNGYSGYYPSRYGDLLKRLEQADASAIAETADGKRVAVVLNPPLAAASPLFAAVVRQAEHCHAAGDATICVLPALRR
jgi:hypothetical protein